MASIGLFPSSYTYLASTSKQAPFANKMATTGQRVQASQQVQDLVNRWVLSYPGFSESLKKREIAENSCTTYGMCTCFYKDFPLTGISPLELVMIAILTQLVKNMFQWCDYEATHQDLSVLASTYKHGCVGAILRHYIEREKRANKRQRIEGVTDSQILEKISTQVKAHGWCIYDKCRESYNMTCHLETILISCVTVEDFLRAGKLECLHKYRYFFEKFCEDTTPWLASESDLFEEVRIFLEVKARFDELSPPTIPTFSGFFTTLTTKSSQHAVKITLV